MQFPILGNPNYAAGLKRGGDTLSRKIEITIDGVSIQVSEETTILDAALEAEIYIPHLCSHPDFPDLPGIKGVQWEKN
jgi:hypothetical protein